MLKLDDSVGLKNVMIWHCNDAKDARGSKRDRHEHIGKGTIGLEAFRRLLNDPRTAHAAFIAETPIDEPQRRFAEHRENVGGRCEGFPQEKSVIGKSKILQSLIFVPPFAAQSVFSTNEFHGRKGWDQRKRKRV